MKLFRIMVNKVVICPLHVHANAHASFEAFLRFVHPFQNVSCHLCQFFGNIGEIHFHFSFQKIRLNVVAIQQQA